jgi:general secretion pathway protein G
MQNTKKKDFISIFKKNTGCGFTLIELLIVISIIGILTGISVFALTGSRESARDTKRKTDIEQIRSALEIYRSDCHQYPASLPTAGSPLQANPAAVNCVGTANTYLQSSPADPTGGAKYLYCPGAGNTTYTLYSYLEDSTATVTGACGSCSGGACRYKVTNP